MEARDIAFWENLRNAQDSEAEVYFRLLDKVGFDARMKVGKEKPIRVRIKVDRGEEWRSWGRRLFDAYNELDYMPAPHRIHALTKAFAGPDVNPGEYRARHSEMKEKVRLMMEMSRSRVKYEYKPDNDGDPYEPVTLQSMYQQLELELAVPHG